MPLNAKGAKIKAAMEAEYGAKRGDSVFYASENSGKIKGVTKMATGGVVSGKGKPIHFNEGGEHASLGVPAGKKIPAKLHAAAAAGKKGKLAQKQEQFRENVLTGPKGAAKGTTVVDSKAEDKAEKKPLSRFAKGGKPASASDMMKAGYKKAGY